MCSFIGDKWEGKCKGVRPSPIQGFLSLRGGWCEPILVGGLTYIGHHRDLYSFVVGPILVSPPTNIG